MLEIEKKVLQFLLNRNNRDGIHASFIDREFPELRVEFYSSEEDQNIPYEYDPKRDKLGQLLIKLEKLGFLTFDDRAFVKITDKGEKNIQTIILSQNNSLNH